MKWSKIVYVLADENLSHFEIVSQKLIVPNAIWYRQFNANFHIYQFECTHFWDFGTHFGLNCPEFSLFINAQSAPVSAEHSVSMQIMHKQQASKQANTEQVTSFSEQWPL